VPPRLDPLGQPVVLLAAVPVAAVHPAAVLFAAVAVAAVPPAALLLAAVAVAAVAVGTVLAAAVLIPAGGQAVHAPARGRLVEPLPRPLHDHQPAAGRERLRHQVQHLAQVRDVVQ